MTASARTALGAAGEQLAADYLTATGMVVLARNWRASIGALRGELDLVLSDAGTLVFCEVKARRGRGAGDPLEAVTPKKVAQIRALASAYLAEASPGFRSVRIDAVGVCWPRGGGDPEIMHLRGVG